MTPASFRERVRAGTTVGVISTVVDPTVVETIGMLGFDFYVADVEHGTASDERCVEFIRACETVGLVPMVRVPLKEVSRMTRLLDAGAGGIVAPRIDSAGEATQLRSLVRFPPAGSRGMSAVRVSRHGLARTDGDFLRAQDDGVVIGIQIETATALVHLDEIATTDVADVLILGTRDLSISLGVAGSQDDPVIADARNSVRAVAGRSGQAFGSVVRTPEEAAALRAEHAPRMILVGLTTVLAHGGGRFVSG